ncbi:unnamed protein product [Cyclocybe aegerita]|uniref:Uncharacterized protein n=1 Tax=Cyclocybe aegerita TaxID=1973307 RepID=A0A8S0WHY3_CYCAE|nr:unnamed protein product [Cyclocybe aegerita]
MLSQLASSWESEISKYGQNIRRAQIGRIYRPRDEQLCTWKIVRLLVNMILQDAELYLILSDAVQANADEVPRGYYFMETFKYSWFEVTAATSEALFELGISNIRKPTAFTL